ncbi:vertnin-like [Ruditapes philippinarum]|uniref:vertnin-like n=1 Tax=Ruditapes philippinarum TaxID=129788 RepID=UPI00295BBC76|nr:vertnin-like [Ruditapes philippinarum]
MNTFAKADEVSVYGNKLEVDFESVVDVPEDIDKSDLYPVEVYADGNCLPSCGSVFAFGTPTRPEEIRTRIIKELSEHEDYYLNNENLNKGLEAKTANNLAKQYAMYSEYFIPGMNLDEKLIQEIFRKEVLSLTQNKSFMGIWQMFALSSVLGAPIKSVYPNKGNPKVREDLNRLILPRSAAKFKQIYILWTNTRDDIPAVHWTPNHFVPLLTFEGVISKPKSTSKIPVESCKHDNIKIDEKIMKMPRFIKQVLTKKLQMREKVKKITNVKYR